MPWLTDNASYHSLIPPQAPTRSVIDTSGATWLATPILILRKVIYEPQTNKMV